jgi:toxin ParE1/3/4
MQVRWAKRAEADLGDLFEYLLDRDSGAALRVHDAILHHVAMLGDQPRLGRPGGVQNTRELVVPSTPYVVAYTIDRHIDAVMVLRVLHGARRWPDEL